MFSKMQFSTPKRLLPSSSSLKSTETLSRSTPESSGTFAAARIFKSAVDATRNGNKESHFLPPSTSYRDAVLKSSCPESGAGLSEQVVKPGQVSAESFYGSGSTSSKTWNTQVSVKMKDKSKKRNTLATKKDLVAKINRINNKGKKKNLPLPPGYFDEDLNFCDDLTQEHQDSHTGLTPPPPLKPFPHAVSEPAPATGNNGLSTSFTRDVDKSSLVEDSEVSSGPSFGEVITSLPSLSRLMVQPHNIGFKNHGNTCYMNSCMQALLGLEMMVTEAINSRQLLGIQDSDKSLVQAFCELCTSYRKGDSEGVDQEMKELKKTMENLDKQFVGNKMQDASEFLGRFLDEIKECVDKLRNSDPAASDGTGLIYGNFVHEKEEELECCDCKSKTRSRSSDMSLWCDTRTPKSMRRSMSLQLLLEQSLDRERRNRRCELCGGEEAMASSRLVRLPRVLIIFLKRFKYSRQGVFNNEKDSSKVTIPDTLSVSRVVSDTVAMPDTMSVMAPKTLHQASDSRSLPLPSSPVTSTSPLSPCLETPTKFKGLTQEQKNMLGEEDMLEYAIFLSEKEALESANKLDDDTKNALEASMRDDGLAQMYNYRAEDARTPSRKRDYGQYVGAGGDDYGQYVGAGGDGHGGVQEEPPPSYAKVVRGKIASSSGGEEVPRPATREQEEEDLKKALEMSALEATFLDSAGNHDVAMDDLENNNNLEEDEFEGNPEHSYKLQSVVSHFGPSSSSGHYVADVFRFDGGGWCRYDDKRVSKTDGETVRTGPNCTNGYVLTYLYQPLWDKYSTSS